MNIYEVSRYVRSGQNDHVVIAASEERARYLVTGGERKVSGQPRWYAATLLGEAAADQTEGIVLSCVWYQ